MKIDCLNAEGRPDGSTLIDLYMPDFGLAIRGCVIPLKGNIIFPSPGFQWEDDYSALAFTALATKAATVFEMRAHALALAQAMAKAQESGVRTPESATPTTTIQ